MKRCSRCILPETYPNIHFNEEGICNVCIEFETRWKDRDYVKAEAKLKRIFRRYRKNRRKYDCIVPISGGVDSTFVLYLAKEVYRLKPLAVNFDNGFQSAQARKNIENAVTKLNVDYISYKPRADMMRRVYSCFLLKAGEFCTPCNKGISATAYRMAEREKVPLIFYGHSEKLEGTSPALYYSDQRYFADVLSGEMSLSEVDDLQFSLLKRPFYRKIQLPSYVDWNENEILETIKTKLDWDKGPDNDSPHHIDCLAAPVSDYLRRKKWGFGKETEKYSAMIRDGQMSKEEALEKITVEEHDEEPAALEFFLEYLNLTKDDIVQAQQRSHTDFKTYNRKLLRIIQKTTSLISRDWNL